MVLHRPIETTRVTGQVKSVKKHLSGNATYRDLSESARVERGNFSCSNFEFGQTENAKQACSEQHYARRLRRGGSGGGKREVVVRKRARCSLVKGHLEVDGYFVSVVNPERTRASTQAGVGQPEELVDCQPVQLGQRIY
jgi:hypothetical protein